MRRPGDLLLMYPDTMESGLVKPAAACSGRDLPCAASWEKVVELGIKSEVDAAVDAVVDAVVAPVVGVGVVGEGWSEAVEDGVNDPQSAEPAGPAEASAAGQG